jgi:calcineurin-like phosphoesterase family protein
MSKIWFTSDHHFNHKNILEYTSRPWKSVEEMNEALILNWNEVVSEEDLVWHLGDFAMGDRSKMLDIRTRLNGRINFVRGNHDYPKTLSCFDEVYKSATIETESMVVEMVHNPRHLKGLGDIGLCGHVHEEWKRCIKNIPIRLSDGAEYEEPTFIPSMNIYNVGVDVRGYYPRSLLEILHDH